MLRRGFQNSSLWNGGTNWKLLGAASLSSQESQSSFFRLFLPWLRQKLIAASLQVGAVVKVRRSDCDGLLLVVEGHNQLVQAGFRPMKLTLYSLVISHLMVRATFLSCQVPLSHLIAMQQCQDSKTTAGGIQPAKLICLLERKKGKSGFLLISWHSLVLSLGWWRMQCCDLHSFTGLFGALSWEHPSTGAGLPSHLRQSNAPIALKNPLPLETKLLLCEAVCCHLEASPSLLFCLRTSPGFLPCVLLTHLSRASWRCLAAELPYAPWSSLNAVLHCLLILICMS